MSTVLNISSLTTTGNERGLLGLAFRGDFAYINYTNTNGHTVIAEYAVDKSGIFRTSSRRELMTILQPYANHNGGDIVTGPDNMLYIGMGDGGSGGDPERNALNTSSLLGKMLRIDPTRTSSKPYTIPTDNPFVGVKGARPEIWSIGLRNPWRFSFDDDKNLWVADVGQNRWEEINLAQAKMHSQVVEGAILAGAPMRASTVSIQTRLPQHLSCPSMNMRMVLMAVL